MTWFDHSTGSIWTQPWGRALDGEFKGTQLKLLPFSLVPWSTWREEHPETLALAIDGDFARQQLPSDDFVIGLAIGDLARAYPFSTAREAVVINDNLGDIPVLVYVNPDNRNIHLFVRQLSDGTELIFTTDTVDVLVDEETGSRWNPERGLAVEGELRGEGLRELPYISSFDWAWLDFYPQSDFYSVASS